MRARPSTRHRRVRRWVDNALVVAIVFLFALGAWAVISGDYQLRPVLSGSMRPGLPVGGVVVTERVRIADLEVRDVVVFHRPDQPDELVVHRIISLVDGATGPVIETQGDANPAADPWTITLRGETAYRAVFAVPLVGYAAVWAHGIGGSRTLMIVGLVLVLVAVIGAIALGRSARRAADGALYEAKAAGQDVVVRSAD